MKKIIVLTIASMALAFSASAGNEELIAELVQKMTEINAEVEELISVNHCTSEDHCSSMAYGSRACGGPDTYLVYSNQTVDEAELGALAGRYTALSQRLNVEAGMISICAFEMPPNMGCVENKCQRVPFFN